MSTPHAIDVARFAELLDRHGPDVARFPEPERSLTQGLLARDLEARELLAAAEQLARALDGLPASQPSAALRRKVAEIPPRNPRPAAHSLLGWALPWSALRSPRRLTLLAVCVVMLGAASGAMSADNGVGVANSDDDWDDLSAVAFATDVDQELAP